jgi:hypothetical protein
MGMKYILEYGKKITHPHVIQIRGDRVWSYYAMNPEAFDNWMNPDVKEWLNDLPPHPKYSWIPSWSPWKPTMRAWQGARPYTSMMLMVDIYGSGKGQTATSVADIYFTRKEDAMKFKLVWA